MDDELLKRIEKLEEGQKLMAKLDVLFHGHLKAVNQRLDNIENWITALNSGIQNLMCILEAKGFMTQEDRMENLEYMRKARRE